MMVNIKYFGAVADATQKREEALYLESQWHTVDDLRQKLEKQYPDLESLAYVIAVNQTVIGTGLLTLSENDELALLPPFAGG